MPSISQLKAISPSQLNSYLGAQGWVEEVDARGRTIWARRIKSDRVSLWIPHDRELSDFPLRVADLFALLARIEERPESEIYEDVSCVGFDLLRASVVSADTGSITLVELTRLAGALVELVERSARDSPVPKPGIFSARYADSVRVMPAQTGSYVLPVLLPQSLVFGPRGIDVPRRAGEEESRHVAIHLANRMHELSLLRGEELELSVGRDRGLYAIAASLGELSRDREALEIQFRWSGSAPYGRSERERLDFSPSQLEEISAFAPQEQVPRLERVQQRAAMLPSPEVIPNFVLEGPVVRLARPDVFISGEINGRSRLVRVPLDPEQYQLALAAHAREAEVRCLGELELQGRRQPKLINLTSFGQKDLR